MTPDQSFEIIRQDRREARSDPKARTYKNKFYKLFEGCSHDELVDLICDLAEHSMLMERDVETKPMAYLKHKLSLTLIGRYFNRHPDQIGEI